MRRTQFLTLLLATITSIALLVGVAAPAQAAEYPSRPKQPDCTGIFMDHCNSHDAWKQIVDLMAKATKSTSAADRAGYIRHMLLALFGRDAFWGDQKKIYVNPTAKGELDTMLGSIGAPSNAAIQCYGNWLLKDIVDKGQYDDRIQYFYDVVKAVQSVKEAKGKISRQLEYVRADSGKKIAKMVLSDVGKKLLDKAGLGEITDTDLSDAYIQMILDSRGPVTQAQSDGRLDYAYYNIVPTCTHVMDPPAKPKLYSKVYVKTLNAKALLAGVDGLGQGSGSNFKIVKYIKGVGGCYITKNVLRCEGYNKAYMDKQPDSGAELRISPSLTLPASIVKAAYKGKVSMQVTASFPTVKGSVSWQYGDYSKPALGTLKRAGSQTLAAVPLNTKPYWGGPVYTPVDIVVPYYNRVDIDFVQIRYAYQTLKK